MDYQLSEKEHRILDRLMDACKGASGVGTLLMGKRVKQALGRFLYPCENTETYITPFCEARIVPHEDENHLSYVVEEE